ncbi:MAG TPA: ABC transporter permease [Rubrivivax sp.]|nr:ABC transporter permease [Rubrivivax sp.]
MLTSWREWRHHPWRHGMALLAVALGVALAWSVHLINASALAEFAAAVRAANGEPDLSLRGQREGFDDALFERAARMPGVRLATPLLEIDTAARAAGGERVPLRVIGLDALSIAAVAPQLLPRPSAADNRFAVLDPERVFVNARARALLGLKDGAPLALRTGSGWREWRVAGDVPAAGAPLVVLDIAGAQEFFGMHGRLTRIDLRLEPGADAQALLAALALPPAVQAAPADAAEQRMSALSRAYRVNLTVLALVALFVGAFLVYSVVSLSLAQRTPGFALLGVLGLTAAERRTLLLAECAALGLAGSLLGLLLGTLLALGALRWLAGDLGGGYFPGIAPALRWDGLAAAGFALLGTASALVGGWMPARRAEALSPAQALKGLGDPAPPRSPVWPALLLLALGVGLAFAPPLSGLPIAAYLSVAALLFGGVALVPAAVQGLLAALPASTHALRLLALQRAKFHRHTASAAVAGVVASLALSVALTVMVTSFRGGVSDWLDQVLPADLYVRSARSSAAAELAWLDPGFIAAAAALPGVQQLTASRVRALQLAPERPALTLIARALAQPAEQLPLLAPPLAPVPGESGVYLSEAAAALYDKRPGDVITLPIGPAGRSEHRVLGIWRDYARQFGAVAIDADAYRALSGDAHVNELAIRLRPGADAQPVRQQLRALDGERGAMELATSSELRALSLAIFDRSFAVTRYLQAVAIAIGLVGVAASLSAQVLARRKEFGLLSHLGLTRAQIIGVVAGEGAAWLAAGTLIGLALGLAVSVVLVHVVNPQSFHWTMKLLLPWGQLLALCAAVLAAGIATAAFSARHAASAAATRAVQEDW